MSEYPECEKMAAVRDKSHTIGEFLEWLGDETPYSICEYTGDDGGYGSYQPTYATIEQLLAKFFDIDLKKVEAERGRILEEISKNNGVTRD